MTSELEALARRVEQLAKPGDDARQALVQGHRTATSAAQRAGAAGRDGASIAASLSEGAKKLEASAAALSTFALNAREFSRSLTQGAQGRAVFGSASDARRRAGYSSFARAGLRSLVSPQMLATWLGPALGEATDRLTDAVAPGQGDLAGEAVEQVVEAVHKALDARVPGAFRTRMTMVQREIRKISGSSPR